MIRWLILIVVLAMGVSSRNIILPPGDSLEVWRMTMCLDLEYRSPVPFTIQLYHKEHLLRTCNSTRVCQLIESSWSYQSYHLVFLSSSSETAVIRQGTAESFCPAEIVYPAGVLLLALLLFGGIIAVGFFLGHRLCPERYEYRDGVFIPRNFPAQVVEP